MNEDQSYQGSFPDDVGDFDVEKKIDETAQHDTSSSLPYVKRSGYMRLRFRNAHAPKRLPPWAVYAIIGASVLLAVGAGLFLFLNRGVGVIDFTDWAVSDAQLWAKENGVNLRIEKTFNDEYETDKVFAQDIKKGTRIEKGKFIGVSVSMGHDPTVQLPLPAILSMTKDQIDAWVAENYMMNVRITAKFSETVKAGSAISFQIYDNAVVDMVRRNTPIDIVVSKGREDPASVKIAVPDFRQMTVTECRGFANDKGIVLIVNEEYDDYAPKGQVIAQSVNANETVNKGGQIAITVSKGKRILVPDFSNYTKQSASAAAAELHIPVTITERYSSQPTGKLVSQNIQAGTVYNDGDMLQLIYSLGNKIIISSYVGQTRDKIETWAKGLNDLGASITIKARYTKSDSPKDRIIYQDRINVSIGIVSAVNITISLGKAVYIPDFVAPAGSGYHIAITCEKATEICEDLNIIPVFVPSKKSGRLPGEIWYQSIAAGKEVTEGITITLKYNPNNVAVTVPDFTGMTEEEIAAAGYEKKLDITFEVAEDYVDGYTGKVCEQSLIAGFHVASGSAVTLTVGPEPSD